MSKVSLAEQSADLRADLEKSSLRTEDTRHILETIRFVVLTAGQDCSNVTAMDHWLVVIDALASMARRVLDGEDDAEVTSNGGAQ